MEISTQKLEEQLSSDQIQYDDFRSCYNELLKFRNKFQGLVEFAAEREKKDSRFVKLHKDIAQLNSAELIESLKKKGNFYKRELAEAFNNMGYRLLEQTRAGKRDDVYYGLLRIFISHNKRFPDELVEAFKPIYSEEMFKVFIFSFLSGIIGKEQSSENKN